MALDTDFILKGLPLGPLPNCSLGEYLIQQMKLHPQNVVIQVDGDTGATQTIGELLARAASVSEGLKKLGLKENDHVGMVCRNTFESSAIVLGSFFSATVIVPFNVESTVDEFKKPLELTQPKVIFCDEEAENNVTAALNSLKMSPRVIILVENKKPQDTRLTFQEFLVDVDLERFVPQPVKSPSTQLVTVLFSSGTSGLPKGVGIPHTSFILQAVIIKLIWPWIQELVFLQISQFFWVTAHISFIQSLVMGTKRVLLRRPTETNVLKAIHMYKPQWSMIAPLFALSIAQHPDFEQFDVSSMKYILVGGSPFTPNIGEKLKKKWPGVKFFQAYGTTELAGIISFTDKDMETYSVGHVAPGLQLKVVDVATGEPLKANASGEIWVKSPTPMKCYINNEKATKEVMKQDGWICTGDIGYYDDARQLYLVDRLKEVVKIMNFQVSPTEIEDELLSVPGVLEAFVTGVTADGDVYELMALVVKENNSDVTEEIINAHIANTFSEYKRLTAGIRFVEELQKTANGKLKRGELRKLAQDMYSAGS